MTADIFKEYLLALDHAMRQQKRYILLLVDNIPPHIPEAGRMLEHVRVLYIRSYATPFFHGIFYSVRSHYRKQVVLKMVASTHGNSSTGTRGRSSKGEKQKGIPSQTVDISLPEALKMLQLAWQSVSPQDIVPCFSRAGICAPYIHGLPEPKVEELPDLPDGFITSEQFEDFVNFDTDVECSGGADLLSAECRILSDLRQQGYTDIGKEDYDDQSLDSSLAHTRSFSAPGEAHAGASSVKMTPNAGALVAAARQDKVGNAEAMGALGVLRSFLDQQNLPLHNLCALEAQIYEYVRQSNA
nr:hypothetical protein BaRGS_001952 [Batillaria attramentaria]